MNGEGARVVISQSAPTLCIQVPIFEAIAASQIARNNELDSGCQADATDQKANCAASNCPNNGPMLALV